MYIYKISYISMYSVIGPIGQDLDHDEVHGCINTCAVQVMTPMDAFNIEITPATWRQKWEQVLIFQHFLHLIMKPRNLFTMLGEGRCFSPQFPCSQIQMQGPVVPVESTGHGSFAGYKSSRTNLLHHLARGYDFAARHWGTLCSFALCRNCD